MSRPQFDAEYLRSIIDYNMETGVFTWRERSDVTRTWNTRYAGKIAGYVWTLPSGKQYHSIRVRDWPFLAHVLAFLHVTGEWPKGNIDHSNNDGLDNAWTNLRIATKTQNAANSAKPRTNTSGFKGVSKAKATGKWRASIKVDAKQVWLGNFDTPEAAHAAYLEKAKEIHGEFARAA